MDLWSPCGVHVESVGEGKVQPGLHPSASTSNTDAKEPGNGKNDVEAVRIDEPVNGEAGVGVEGEEVTTASCAMSPSTALKSSTTQAFAKGLPPSMAPCISSFTPTHHQECPIPLPHSFANVIPNHLARFSSGRRCTRHSVSSSPRYSFSTTQQRRCSIPSPINSPTPHHFQQ